MLFNSYIFVAFFVVVYALYWALRHNYRAQNRVLLVASYLFYGNWDWRFLFLLAGSTIVDYLMVLRIEGTTDPRARKRLFAFLIAIHLGVLGVFKYFNFFADGAAGVLGALGIHADFVTLRILLPVGISFYTFHEISYATDVYLGRVRASRNLAEYALFISFFPLLVAGPIARATHLLPQIESARRMRADQINAALFLLLWGYFKKVVVADNAGRIADQIFNGYERYSGLDPVLGVLAFAVQIYGDFSGYSDIARGLAKLMGFELGVNFRLPYFALNPSDFWARWHISLSTWLRDYLYVPLGGNRRGPWITYRNLSITMLLGGLWHGAAWNFVLWGAYHGLLLIVYRIADHRSTERGLWSGPSAAAVTVARMATMFVLTMIGWLIFRAKSASQIMTMLGSMGLAASPATAGFARDLAFFTAPLVIVEVWQYGRRDLLAPWHTNVPFRVALATLILGAISVFGVRTATEFIYFQF